MSQAAFPFPFIAYKFSGSREYSMIKWTLESVEPLLSLLMEIRAHGKNQSLLF